MTSRTLYAAYIVMGVLYVAVKIVYVSAGYLHLGAIAHGAIPAVLTIAVGVLAARENTWGSRKSNLHTLMIVLPLLVLVITPLYMYVMGGDMWLANGRRSVLIVFEGLAVMQIVVAVAVKRKAPA